MADSISKTGKSYSGFTIIELMIVIAVLGVFIAIAMPSFQDTIKRNKVVGQLHDLNADLNFTRGEAASKGQSVAICGARDVAMTQCSDSGDWSIGWLVFTETFVPTGGANKGKTLVNKAKGDVIIRSYKYDGTNTLAVTESDGTTALTGLTYSPQGYLKGSKAALLKICPSSNEVKYARGVVISPSGRALTTRDTDGDGVHDHTTDDGLGSGTSVASSGLTCP